MSDEIAKITFIGATKNIYECGKADFEERAKSVESLISEGNADPLKTLVAVKKMIALYSAIEEKVRPIAEGDFKHNSKEVNVIYNTEIVQKDTGVSYDYAACNDTEWANLKSTFDLAKEALSKRETFLKTITKDFYYTDTDTGESWIIKPPVRKAKLGLTLTIK